MAIARNCSLDPPNMDTASKWNLSEDELLSHLRFVTSFDAVNSVSYFKRVRFDRWKLTLSSTCYAQLSLCVNQQKIKPLSVLCIYLHTYITYTPTQVEICPMSIRNLASRYCICSFWRNFLSNWNVTNKKSVLWKRFSDIAPCTKHDTISDNNLTLIYEIDIVNRIFIIWWILSLEVNIAIAVN